MKAPRSSETHFSPQLPLFISVVSKETKKKEEESRRLRNAETSRKLFPFSWKMMMMTDLRRERTRRKMKKFCIWRKKVVWKTVKIRLLLLPSPVFLFLPIKEERDLFLVLESSCYLLLALAC